MRFSKTILLLLWTISALALAPGCSSNQSQSGACDGSSTTGGMPAGSGSLTPSCDPSRKFTQPTALATNAMSVSVNGSLCTGAGASGGMYPDEICATVTICTPGCDGQCQVINDVLLDTGSYGLRLFKNIINIPLQQVSNDGGQTAVAECVGFGDGSSEWGPVQIADIQLANEPVIHNVPIMTIDSSYSCIPSQSGCNPDSSTPDTSPSQSSFNGILGVGLFAQDCGGDCESDSGNLQYFSCERGVGCGGTTVATNLQVTNPISLLGTDNNGVILKLPSVADGGVPSLDSGSIVFGIDTEANNSSSGMKFLTADGEGTFRTTFQGGTDPSFIDSGSSDLAFGTISATGVSSTSIPDCSAYDSTSFGGTGDEFYCPSSTQPLAATQTGADGSESSALNFTLESAYDLLFVDNSGQNFVFSTIGGPSCIVTPQTMCPIKGDFDWGLPFFFGRNIAVSLDQTSFNLGTGPGWAY